MNSSCHIGWKWTCQYMGFLILLAIILSFTVFNEDKGDGIVLKQISFNGHTYIHMNCKWNHAGDAFLHDPGCECLKKSLTEK